MKILYIDDDHSDQLLMERYAPEHEYTFLSQLPDDPLPLYDLIFLDVNMTPKSGYAIYSELRGYQTCKIILTTGSVSNTAVVVSNEDKIISKDKLFRDLKGIMREYGRIDRQGKD